MPDTFTVRTRSGASSPQTVTTGGLLTLDERVEYLLSCDRAFTEPERRRLSELGGELLREDLASLSFLNFVGRTHFAGIHISVVSEKIGESGVSLLLEEISAISSSLIFSWRTPTGLAAAPNIARHGPVPYHQLQYLRHHVLRRRIGERFQDWFHLIERNPTRRFEPERPIVPLSRVRRLDSRAMQSIFQRSERLVPVEAGAAIGNNALAQKLTFGVGGKKHFPYLIAAPSGRLSFDTPENRFVRHVLAECLSLAYRFVDHPKLHETLKADCREIVSILEPIASAPYLADAGMLSGFQLPSQALTKADGYREIFRFWNEFVRHVSLPLFADETARLLEGRDVATLYEYWVFAKVLQTTVEITGLTPLGPPVITRDELGEGLAFGISLQLGNGVAVSFNPTFRRSQRTAYSTPLRPDVVLQKNSAGYVFDAKYRLDRLDVADTDADDMSATYKRADLYKMHTYRDAINGINAAFVVYPGTEFVFFERAWTKRSHPDDIAIADGVGAVPLRPAATDPAGSLRAVLRKLLS